MHLWTISDSLRLLFFGMNGTCKVTIQDTVLDPPVKCLRRGWSKAVTSCSFWLSPWLFWTANGLLWTIWVLTNAKVTCLRMGLAYHVITGHFFKERLNFLSLNRKHKSYETEKLFCLSCKRQMKKTRKVADGASTYFVGLPLRKVAISKIWIQEHSARQENN